jgi:aryl-alcohol dehydrogenase-like predicted oxidoreductase
MRYRTFGQSGWKVSEVGLGAWGIGGALWKGSDDATSTAALNRAVDLGVNFIDTALAYGQGHSERLIGRLLKERKERIFVATKIPPRTHEWPVPWERKLRDVYPKDYIVSCTETSLKNLGVERIDLQQLHVWSPNWTDETEWREAVAKLKKEGKIDRIGISLNDHQPDTGLDVARTGLIDAFQVIYNIFDPTPAEKLFPLCRREGIALIARCPLDEGALTGAITAESRFDRGDWRSDYFRGGRKAEVAKRAERLKTLMKPAGTKSLAELALRFCLSHNAVSTVIPGTRTPSHAEENTAAADDGALPKGVLDRLREMAWAKNFYD